MNCAETGRLASSYLDGELDLSKSLALERHRAGCARCHGLLDAIRMVSTRLRIEAPYYRAPGTLRSQIAGMTMERATRSVDTPARIPTPIPAAPQRKRRRIRGVALTFALVAGIGIGWLLVPRSPWSSADERLTSEAVEAHVRSMLSNHAIDINNADPNPLKAWLLARLNFVPIVPNLSTNGFQLIGARLDQVAGQRAGVVVYKRRQHIVDLIMLPTASGFEASPGPQAHRGFNVVRFNHGGLRLIAVSDLNVDELSAFARYVGES